MSRPPIKPYDVFAQAEAFATSAKILFEEGFSTHNIALSAPTIVNRALAIELYLKCLLLLDGKQPWGHELTKLFSALLPDTQNDVKALYSFILPGYQGEIDQTQRALKERGLALLSTDFDSALSVANNSFISIRYIYENIGSVSSNVTMHVIELATRAHIIARKNDWDTGHPALISSFVNPAPLGAAFYDPNNPLIKENSQFTINAPCWNGTCTQQVALVFNMEPDLTFPMQHPLGPPLVLYPKDGFVECPKCHSKNDHSAARRHIEDFTGRSIYLS